MLWFSSFSHMNTSEKSLVLCYAIEAAGASEALTKCSVLASELRTEIVAESARLSRLSESMKRFVAEYYPPDKNGQVHFARALIEAYAQEIVAPDELNAQVTDAKRSVG